MYVEQFEFVIDAITKQRWVLETQLYKLQPMTSYSDKHRYLFITEKQINVFRQSMRSGIIFINVMPSLSVAAYQWDICRALITLEF